MEVGVGTDNIIFPENYKAPASPIIPLKNFFTVTANKDLAKKPPACTDLIICVGENAKCLASSTGVICKASELTAGKKDEDGNCVNDPEDDKDKIPSLAQATANCDSSDTAPDSSSASDSGSGSGSGSVQLCISKGVGILTILTLVM